MTEFLPSDINIHVLLTHQISALVETTAVAMSGDENVYTVEARLYRLVEAYCAFNARTAEKLAPKPKRPRKSDTSPTGCVTERGKV